LTVARDGIDAIVGGAHGGDVGAGDSAHQVYPDNVEAYDVAADTWTVLPNSTTTQGKARATTVALDGRIYVVGTDNFNFFSACNTYGPHLQRMSSDRVPAGAPVILAGDNFGPNAAITVYLGTQKLAASARSDGTGTLAPLTVTMPSSPLGRSWLYVVDDASHYPVRAAITVGP
jgi:hypothetical protein